MLLLVNNWFIIFECSFEIDLFCLQYLGSEMHNGDVAMYTSYSRKFCFDLIVQLFLFLRLLGLKRIEDNGILESSLISVGFICWSRKGILYITWTHLTVCHHMFQKCNPVTQKTGSTQTSAETHAFIELSLGTEGVCVSHQPSRGGILPQHIGRMP